MASLEEPPAQQSVREEFYADIVKSYLQDSLRQRLKLVVIGETGQGKSTLINGLLGKEVANEGEDFDAGTAEIKYYTLDQNGVHVEIWDTPGFGMGSIEEDEKMVETLRRSECYPHDLALFCFRMDGTRFPTRVHIDTIKKFTEVFKRNFWKHTVFILTFANNVSQLCPPNEELEYFFSNRVWELEEKVRQTLKKHIKMSDEELRAVRVIPVGSYKQGLYRENPWALPGRDDWFVWFWMECTDHMRKTAVSALLQANRHRIKIVSNESEQPMPPSDVHKPSERVIETSRGEVPHTIYDDPSECDEPLPGEEEENVTTSSIPDPNFVPQNSSQPSSTNATENIANRGLPIGSILGKHLKDKDSSFSMYVNEYVKKRGEQLWGLRHIAGFFEGFIEWLRGGDIETENKKTK